jgi:surfeit locus 1 family protein
MKAARWSVRFWVVTAATALTMGVTGALGVWQLGRAAQKADLEARIERQGALPPWTNRELLGDESPELGIHRKVDLTGHWAPGVSVFLDNRPMNGRSGFVLLTPLRLAGSERAVLVQRGWVPRDFQDRSKVPAVETPMAEVRVQGRLAPPPSRLFELGAGSGGPIRQNIDLQAFARETGLQLLVDVSVLQSGGEAPGLERHWPRFATDVHKHHGYAAQWFAMCAVAGFLYLWFQIIIPRRKRSTHGTDS